MFLYFKIYGLDFLKYCMLNGIQRFGTPLEAFLRSQ